MIIHIKYYFLAIPVVLLCLGSAFADTSQVRDVSKEVASGDTAPESSSSPGEPPLGPKIRVAMYDVPSVQNISMIAAAKMGFYEAQGLPPVEFIWRDEEHTAFELLCSGKAEFAVAWMAEGIVARSEGQDIIAISRCNQFPSLAFFVWSGKNPSIKKIEDLEGRKVGYNFRAELTGKALPHALGVHTEEYAIRSDSTLALTSGGLDCIALPAYRFDALQKYLRIRNQFTVFQAKDYAYNFPENMMFCRRDFLRAHPDACRQFVTASFLGARYAIEHRKEAIGHLCEYFKEGKVHDDEFILEQQAQKWLESLELKAKPTENGLCLERNYNALLEAMIDAELVDKEKAPSYSDCFCSPYSVLSEPESSLSAPVSDDLPEGSEK
ncbi:MAG: ABC transporter substrate-binding protein [Planctomycetia bacterium]|nr:ABC transporter substrate-binding protein [Planctomycetia bacterium]